MPRSLTTILSLLLFILSIPILLTGCATMRPSVEKPTISVADLRIQEVKALEAIFMLELRIMNPNDFPLDIRGINCNLKIDGNHFASGLSDTQQEIPAFGTATMPVMVYASMLDMVSSVIQMLQGVDQRNGSMEPLHYALAGKVRLGGTGSPDTLPFQTEGVLDLTGKGNR